MKQIGRHAGQVLAVAALGAAGVAQAHEWQINDALMLGVGGTVELAYTVVDAGGQHTNQLIDNGSGIAFVGEYAFTETLLAYFSGEYDFALNDLGEDDDDSTFDTDHAYVGLSTELGTLQAGEWDGIYDAAIISLLDFPEVTGPTGAPQTEPGASVTYFSPEFHDFSFAVEGFFDDDVHGAADGGDDQSFQVAVKYEAERLGIYLAYDDMGYDEGQQGSIGVGASYELAPLALTAKIEHVGEDSRNPDSGLDADGAMLYGVAAYYDYGHGTVAGLVERVDARADQVDDRTELGINVTYDVADNLYVYAEHMRYDFADGAGDITAAGLVFAF